MCAKAKSKIKKRTLTHFSDNIVCKHGEKAILVLVVLLVAWMVTNGSGLDKFTLTPEQITDASKRASENIQNSKVKPVEVDPGVVVYDYSDFSNLIKTAVKVNAYETPVRWEQSLFPDKIKRPDVKPLSVENLKAIACIGSIQYRDKSASAATPGMAGGMDPGMAGGMSGGAAAGVKTEGKQWIVVTGSIPVRKQLTEYMNKFGSAQYTDSYRDQPKYIYYDIERGTPDDTGKVTWTKIDLIKTMRKENNQWAGIGMEPVDISYFVPVDPNYPPMAMSCPPMTNRTFSEEAANLPNIPVQSDEMMEQASVEMEKQNQLRAKMQDIKLDDILKQSPFAATDNAGGMGGGMMGGGMMGGGMMGGGMMGGGMMGGMDPGMAAGGMGGPGMMGGMDPGMGGQQNQGATSAAWMINKSALKTTVELDSAVAPVDYYLFRFFDFDVVQGKTYYYRVKLHLANPNYGLDANFVEDQKTIAQTFVTSDYSELSNPVSLGTDSRIYFEQILEDDRAGRNSSLTVSSIYFDKDSASESITKSLKVVRGQVANFPRQTHKPIDSMRQTTMDMMGGMGMSGMDPGMGMMGQPMKKKSNKDSGKTVDHNSNICVLDVVGGFKIPNSELRSPAKALILEPNGLIQMRSLSDDIREVNRFETKPASGGMGGMSGGLGPGGPMGGIM